jgi:hypothetical protein
MYRTFAAAAAFTILHTSAWASEQDLQPEAPAFLAPKIGLSSKPAVDGPSYKIEIFGGSTQSELATTSGFTSTFPLAVSDQYYWTGFGGGVGSMTMPLSHNLAHNWTWAQTLLALV